MLYDATTDQIISESGLFDKPIIDDEDHPSSRIVYSTDESFKEIKSELEITGSLKLSVLCGLFKVEGSGKYHTHEKNSHNKERIEMVFSGRTRVKELNIPSTFEDKEHRICKLRNRATHVVTMQCYLRRKCCLCVSTRCFLVW